MNLQKVLIANRGEIAGRIARTCRKLGIASVAIYSDHDSRAAYLQEADEAAPLSGTRLDETYLNGERIIAVARERGCQAIHPGYGFLSENPAFAASVERAGLVFVGPPALAIARLGDKLAAKELAREVGVPVVPGHAAPLADLDEALRVAEALGYPVLLKPAAGGGGRGMRVVLRPEELEAALAQSRAETRRAFSDERIFLEKLIPRPRHIEVQIAVDCRGEAVYLGERECSIQRRHQKVLEEAPSPAVDQALRAEMGRVACALVRAAGYRNLGTVEFLLGPDRRFYFLEVNTRLQVEHPVTEAITGQDLVEWQLRLAAGEPLPLDQQRMELRGAAMEARICAEDPARRFLPTTGMITRYAVPSGHGIRVDSGVQAGSVVTIHFDSLLAKVVAWGADRDAAREALVRGLNGTHIEGLPTNVDFVSAVVCHPAFARAELHTGFLDEHFPEGANPVQPAEVLHRMAIAAVLVHHTRNSLVRESLKPMSPLVGSTPGPRRGHAYVCRAGPDLFEMELDREGNGRHWSIAIGKRRYEVLTPEFEYYRRRLVLKIDGGSHMFRLQYEDQHIKVFHCGVVRTFELYTPREWELAAFMHRVKPNVEELVLRCPMPGVVTRVFAGPGAGVHRGDEVIRMESMKMESGIASPRDGRVAEVLVEVGQIVGTDEPLLRFAESEPALRQ